jgi:hypothetical protein
MPHEDKRAHGHAAAAPPPASPLSYADYLREREHHCRQSAAASAGQDVRRTYLGFARYYETMAEDVER